jgi:hypothetical protein
LAISGTQAVRQPTVVHITSGRSAWSIVNILGGVYWKFGRNRDGCELDIRWILGTGAAVGLSESKNHVWTSTSVWTERSPLGLHGQNLGLESSHTREVVGT